MAQEKDRLGDKLRDAERGREDHYFQERDRKLIDKLRRDKEEAAEAAERQASTGRCPRCGTKLVERKVRETLTVDDCPSCGGIWFDRGEFEELARKEKGLLGRLMGLPD
jgi:hypothetical protein